MTPVPPGSVPAKVPPRLWPRFLAASLIIVISMATATASAALLQIYDFADELGGKLPGVRAQLKEVEGGEPQTILILGSDKRPPLQGGAPEKDKGRSDTTMLLRLDADRNLISLLSLPRDLKVNIPGHGIDRLNAAYTIGGPQLTLEVVRQLTGLDVAHLVNVDFRGFAEAVDAIDCVLVDVDRDYFHSNVGLPPELQYDEINVDAGYQQLCGLRALDYVRYRHEDNDLVRAARQQDFLREARQKVPPTKLITDEDNLIDIFTKYTTSDIDRADQVIQVLKLFIELRNSPIRKVRFQGDIGGPKSSYVTASNDQIEAAVDQFLGADGGGRDGGRGKPKRDGDDGDKAERDVELIDASDAARRYALRFDSKLRFPVYAPTELAPGSTYSDDSRAYKIHTRGEEGGNYPAYKLVFQRPSEFGIPEYYGVMGTEWENPPILDNASETREIGNRDYLLFYDGGELRLVGWKTDEGSYWVNNTLLHSLSEPEMLAIAESMRPYSPNR